MAKATTTKAMTPRARPRKLVAQAGAGSVLMVPALEAEPWPTLGPQVCAWIERNLVFGPGDLLGKQAKLSPEKRALIFRMYEVYPEDHSQAGRRRFRRVAISLRKGLAKTELAAWIAAAELSPTGPVRCVGWKNGNPLGGPVTDPYVPMVAYTEEQTEELAYGALRLILEHSKVAEQFDIGLERIVRVDGSGKAVALASSPDARDGARTTFQHFDETHRFVLPALKRAHRAMLANLPKRKAADPWALETTTAPAPGENSVAEDTMAYARAVAEGRAADARLFFFHRQASEEHDLETPKGRRAAVLEASGADAEWSDIEGILEQWDDPTTDRSYLARVWLNQLRRTSDRAFDVKKFKALGKPGQVIPPGALIALGFDGSRRDDACGLVATEITTGFQQTLGKWERPHGAAGENWDAPETEVSAAVHDAFGRYDVFRLYADPPYWESTVANWAGEFGEERVVAWWTNRYAKMTAAVRSYTNAIEAGEVSHDDDEALVRHVANSHKRMTYVRDDKGERMHVICKDRKNSPNKMDLAMCAVLSWQARQDALTMGAAKQPVEQDYSVVWA